MLIHATIKWPDIISKNLWPFVLQLAVDLHNNTPGPSGLTPTEIFTGIKSHTNRLDFHPFGCPIFVLDPTLQQGHKLPHWKPCSRVGVYLGHSPLHASSIPLVLSTTTGLVSPQFHVVYNDHFTTTTCLAMNTLPENWKHLLATSSTNYVDDDFDPQKFSTSSWYLDDINDIPLFISSSLNTDSTLSQREIHVPSDSSSASQRESPTTHPGWNANHKYEMRFRKKFIPATVTSSDQDNPTTPFDPDLFEAFIAVQDSYPMHSEINLPFLEYISCAARTNPDVLHYGSMLKDPDHSSFETDLIREVNELITMDTVEITPKTSVPSTLKILPSIWSFRCKRAPDWTIIKHKARLCLHGGKQVEGEHFWATYAPVVNWHTVRLVLILSLLANLKSRQIDYVNAFTQAPADCGIFMSTPAAFAVSASTLQFIGSSSPHNNSDCVLRIKKNMYGLRQAGSNWFDALRSALINLGFCQSSHDPCLFIRKDCLLLVYVDDCLLFGKTDDILDSIVTSLQKDCVLTSQGSVGDYLGINIRRTSDGFLELVQPGLINKIITDCGLQDQSSQHNTPANMILTADLTGPPREHSWNYRSIIGMLNYLASSTRPDIAFTMHQCARFTTSPRHVHELAIWPIVRYLKATSTCGYILKPSQSFNLDCFVDADFAGTWSTDMSEDPSSVKSRTGYVITFASCHVLWCSKLQSEIALSTTEAKYIALSQSARDLIPMQGLLQELSAATKLIVGSTIALSTIFEDNKGCVELASAPHMRPRTRHIALKYHHFRSFVESGQLRIQWIDTAHQLADIFTKPLPVASFTFLREILLGW